MSASTRQKMVAGVADLVSRRGIHATSLRDVVQYTGTPRGSLAHHFPGGKQQMLEEALLYAADAVALPLEALMREKGAMAGLKDFFGWWRRILVASSFEAGCPVLAIAVEQVVDDADIGPGRPSDRLRELADAAFERWQSVLAESMERDGLSPDRARRLAALVVASIEGTVAMCRAARSLQPLDLVQQELEAVLIHVIETR